MNFFSRLRSLSLVSKGLLIVLSLLSVIIIAIREIIRFDSDWYSGATTSYNLKRDDFLTSLLYIIFSIFWIGIRIILWVKDGYEKGNNLND